MKRPVGFTLIELLVVISIIALLIGILLPAIGRVREIAKNTLCKTRINQVFLAQSMYANDHGVYTTLWQEDDGSFSESGPEPVTTRLEPYMSMSKQAIESPESVMQCPSLSDDELLTNFDYRNYGARPSSIGINGAMYFDRWAFNPERVPNTSGIIVIAEQAVEPFEEVLTADGVGVGYTGSMAYWNRYATHKPERGYRHGGIEGSNVAMADGHVQQLGHEALKRDSGHWCWWNTATDPMSSTAEETGCGCQ